MVNLQPVYTSGTVPEPVMGTVPMDRFSSVHPPFTLVPAQPVRVVLNASRDCLNETRELATYESKWCRLVVP